MAATVSDKIADARTRNTAYLLRFGRQQFKRQATLIDAATADLIAKLQARAPADGTFTTARLEAMLASTRKRGNELYGQLLDFEKEDMRALSVFESKATHDAISKAYPIEMVVDQVSPTQIFAAGISQPFRGKILRGWYRDQNVTIRKQYDAALRIAFVEGETIPQATSRLRAIGGLEKREAEAIARTAINHFSTQAMKQTTLANADILDHEEWVSTLDGRTSDICMGLDGKKLPIGAGQYPPAHFNCRSVRIPVTKSFASLTKGLDDDDPINQRPFVSDRRKLKDIPKSQRSTVIGTTTKKTYNDWLRTQPKEFVVDVLGPNRAKLYLDGNLSLDKFTDRKGTAITLKSLEAKHERAFKAADVAV